MVKKMENLNDMCEKIDDKLLDEDIESEISEFIEEEKENKNTTINHTEEIKKEEKNNVTVSKDTPKISKELTSQIVRKKEEQKRKELLKKIEEEKKNKLVLDLSEKYHISKEELDEKIEKYKSFSNLRDSLEDETTDEEYLKKAIISKKYTDESNLVSSIITSVVDAVVDSIKDDNTIEKINQKEIYKKEYLDISKKEILRCVEEYSKIYNQKDCDDKDKLLNQILESNIFTLFLKHFNTLPLDISVLEISKLFYGENGIKNYFSFLRQIIGGEEAKEQLKTLYNKISNNKFKVDSIFKL